MKRFWNWSAGLSRSADIALPPAGARAFAFRAPRFGRPPKLWIVIPASVLLAVLSVGWEMHTSTFQSHWFAHYAKSLTWTVEKGPCPNPMTAPSGPYDGRLGYRKLPELQANLTQHGFVITRQACPSAPLAAIVRRGIAPPYPEKDTGTLRILDRDRNDLYRAPLDKYHFVAYDDIPPLLVQSLLYIENRQLLDDERPHMNPALEWDRLAYATGQYAVEKVTRSGSVAGGSTLATQIEKFRHSPEGRTSRASDKLRQIVAASLRAYRSGTDTRERRREIIVDYINSMPLGAALGEGEVTGLGHGMWAWFGKSPQRVRDDLALPDDAEHVFRKAETYKQVLALVMATRRPTMYLTQDHSALEQRLLSYLGLLREQGIISPALSRATRQAKLQFSAQVPRREVLAAFSDRKATNAVRTELLDLLNVPSLYSLDRYDLTVETSLDEHVQEAVTATLKKLSDPNFLAENGFYGEHLLGSADPKHIVYSFSLYESGPDGNRMRVHADNLNKPLDIIRGVKLELGSTAKLRTMANYMMLIANLYQQYHETPNEALRAAERTAPDPLTRWSLAWVRQNPSGSLDDILEASLERTFSASPQETFFTGGGLHNFANFDDKFDESVISLRTALQNSVNLVYIRLMREIVQYYTAQLGYDTHAILGDYDQAERKPLLDSAMEREARTNLWTFYRRYEGLSYVDAIRKMCGKDARGLRRFSIFYLTEHPAASLAELGEAARKVYPDSLTSRTSLLESAHRAYAGKQFTPGDEAYLLGRHPLEVWMVRDHRDHPKTHWKEVVERSADARRRSNEWINRTRFRHAQDLRLRIEMERRAFVEIHKAWKSLGYPFDELVPSLATAIGSSADRPYALAEFVGIVQNEGMRTPFMRVEALRFAEGTPYETRFEPAKGPGQRVMPRAVALAMKQLMHEVVEQGTARRIQGVLKDENGVAIPIGGKTGTGDNRYEKFAPGGALISSRSINRTATFVFLIGDHFFGMVSAFVPGEDASHYNFSSALALQTFKVLAPAVNPLIAPREPQPAHATHARPDSSLAGSVALR